MLTLILFSTDAFVNFKDDYSSINIFRIEHSFVIYDFKLYTHALENIAGTVTRLEDALGSFTMPVGFACRGKNTDLLTCGSLILM